MHQLLLFSSVDLSFVLETLRREALADGDESQVFLRSVASSTCRGFVSRRHLPDLYWISSGSLLCCFLLLGKRSRGGSMLDINLFRVDKGYDPQEIRESQKRRGASVELVDQVIAADKKWRQYQYELITMRKDVNILDKKIREFKFAKQDAEKLVTEKKNLERLIDSKEKEMEEVQEIRDAFLSAVGNLVHETVPCHKDEENNEVIRTWGLPRQAINLWNHVDLAHHLGIVDLEAGRKVAGNRGYFLKDYGVLLNQALVNYGLSFLLRRGYTLLQTPFFMQKDVMSQCAQLSQFDDELYKVSGEGDDKYLIATAEQPLSTFHRGQWMDTKSLPIRYAGYSTCFRKEAGSHGKDTLGLFRVHQFEKVEQFCITSPHGTESWTMLEEMLKNSEDFYQELGLPYRVVSVVSGVLNDAAAKKYDLEAWFPASQKYRELVSCSNCTDYQSRNLEIRYGQKKKEDKVKHYVHLLNSTLTATERTLCCILENYQTKEGVKVPEKLQPFMMGMDFLPFRTPIVKTAHTKIIPKIPVASVPHSAVNFVASEMSSLQASKRILLHLFSFGLRFSRQF